MIIYDKKLPGRKPETLCWYCKNAAGGCRWSDGFRPVPGWKAVATVIYSSRNDEGIKSHLVLDCPEFVKDSPEPEANRRKRRRLLDKRLYDAVTPDKPAERCGTCLHYRADGGVCVKEKESFRCGARAWCSKWKERQHI